MAQKNAVADLSIRLGGFSSAKLRFAAFGGALSWFLHLSLCYLLAEFLCVASPHQPEVGGINAAALALAGITAVLFIASSIALTLSLTLRRQTSYTAGQSSTIYPFVARFSLYCNLYFTIVIIAQTVTVLFWAERC